MMFGIIGYIKLKINDMKKVINEWINVETDESKPMPQKNRKFLSVDVEVRTPLGDGVGCYNYMDDDWLIELYGDKSDELQAYKEVTHWRDLPSNPKSLNLK